MGDGMTRTMERPEQKQSSQQAIYPKNREFWMKLRQARLAEVAAIEDCTELDIPRRRCPHCGKTIR